MAMDWHLTLSRDSTILDAIGAPGRWIGSQLHDRDDIPQDLKDAGRLILSKANHSASHVAELVPLQSLRRSVSLSVVDAMLLRRAGTDLDTLLRSVLAVAQSRAEASDVTLHIVDTKNEVPLVPLDAEKVAWAIRVLVENALKHVRRGTRLMPGGKVDVCVTSSAVPSEVTVEVHDDGPGISGERLQTILSARRDQSPSGRELGMVREIVEAHGGRLEIYSDTEPFRHGTSVRLIFPAF